MIVVDVETVGLDERKSSLVSIGAVDFCDPSRQFYVECRVWDGAVIEQGALNVNGFTREQVLDPQKKSLEAAIKEFIAWTEGCEDKTFAGQNVSFDYRFLRDAANRAGLLFRFAYRCMDLHSLCRAHMMSRRIQPPLKDRKTDLDTNKALMYAGLPAEPDPHNALTGAKMIAEALKRLIHGRSLLPEFAQYDVPVYLLRA